MSTVAPTAVSTAVSTAARREALRQFATETFGMDLGCYPESLIQAIVRDMAGPEVTRDAEWRKKALQSLSIGETHFLRHRSQFHSLARWVRQHPVGADETLRVWSAASSTGEEVWSIAATLREMPELRGRFAVEGSDINPKSIETAQRGTYRRWSMRTVTDQDAEGWLETLDEDQGGATVRVVEALRPHVRFLVRNLKLDAYPAQQDIIFCRNVLIYFGPEDIQMVYRKLFHALKPGGVLFIAATDPEPEAAVGFDATYDGTVRLLVRPDPAARAPAPAKAAARGTSAPSAPSRWSARSSSAASSRSSSAGSSRSSSAASSRSTASSRSSSSRFSSSRSKSSLSRSTTSTASGRSTSRSPAPAPGPAARAVSRWAQTRPAPPAPAPAPAAPPVAVEDAGVAEARRQVRMLLQMVRDGATHAALAQVDDLVEAHPGEVRYSLVAAEIALKMNLDRVALGHARHAQFLQPDAIWPNHLMGTLLLRQGPSPYGAKRLALARQQLAQLGPSDPVPFTGGRTRAELSETIHADARSPRGGTHAR